MLSSRTSSNHRGLSVRSGPTACGAATGVFGGGMTVTIGRSQVRRWHMHIWCSCTYDFGVHCAASDERPIIGSTRARMPATMA